MWRATLLVSSWSTATLLWIFRGLQCKKNPGISSLVHGMMSELYFASCHAYIKPLCKIQPQEYLTFSWREHVHIRWQRCKPRNMPKITQSLLPLYKIHSLWIWRNALLDGYKVVSNVRHPNAILCFTCPLHLDGYGWTTAEISMGET